MARRARVAPVAPEAIDLDDLRARASLLGRDPQAEDIMDSPRLARVYQAYGYVSKLDWEAACRKRPELVSVIRQAAADGMMEMESKMRSLFMDEGSVTAGTFLLKGLDPGVYGDKTDVKMTQSVTFRDPLEDVPDEELASRLTTILGARARWGGADGED